MDMTSTIAPRSDQVNAEDLLSGPVTVTVANVREGTAEQPVDIDLVEFPGRAYRPSKTMRRVLVLAWGPDSTAYIGRRLTLYRDPDVKFGRDTVGGIKISHLSHLPKRMSWALTESRGKRKPHTVEPLPNVAPTTLARMPEETSDRIEALMVRLELDEGKERAATAWATNGRTDDWTTLTPDESARLISFLESKLPADPAETPGQEPLL